jgi:hypothetical protein
MTAPDRPPLKPTRSFLMALDEIARDGTLEFACPVLVVVGGYAPSFTVMFDGLMDPSNR